MPLSGLCRQTLGTGHPATPGDPGDHHTAHALTAPNTGDLPHTQIDQEMSQLIGYPYGTIPRLLLYWITRGGPLEGR